MISVVTPAGEEPAGIGIARFPRSQTKSPAPAAMTTPAPKSARPDGISANMRQPRPVAQTIAT